MRPSAAALPPEAARFRRRVLVAMMVVVSACTLAALVLTRRGIDTDERVSREREFRGALTTLHQVRQVRHAALLERCRALARKPRIHAALEDGALDLLYLNAADELRDVLDRPGRGVSGPGGYALQARFYRFLDATGDVIPPGPAEPAGILAAADEPRLALPGVPARPQLGFLAPAADPGSVSELIATPILSTETGEPIAALVLGFPPVPLRDLALRDGATAGIWLDGHLRLAGWPETAVAALSRDLARSLAKRATDGSFRSEIGGEPALVFHQQLNAGSLFPPAHEVCVFPLGAMIVRQRRLGWQIVTTGAALVLGGFVASHVVARRLAVPVERLEHDSAEQRSHRERAEAALETTSAELQRAARFSADASHQLKTPVTVLRAGLEELLAKAALTPQECDEVSALIHQTYRLSGIIEDLLLLSRIDAGRLKINFGVVDLAPLIAASLDDLEAIPDESALAIETDLPATLPVAGERRYLSLILQNLLENARKYNRPGGRIRLAARQVNGVVALTIANTARQPIPPAAQAHIFERFHRGPVGENIPGYGLGLNLARELARIHDGDLRLVRSDEAWTELEVRFRAASPA